MLMKKILNLYMLDPELNQHVAAWHVLPQNAAGITTLQSARMRR
jgi:hypothetical protein